MFIFGIVSIVDNLSSMGFCAVGVFDNLTGGNFSSKSVKNNRVKDTFKINSHFVLIAPQDSS